MRGLRATGVEAERCGEVSTHRADEVVLCAGAYNSPQLLMLSGIGPSEHLAALGIEPRLDLPVGDNLQEHPGVPVVFETDRETLVRARSEANWARYRRDATGPLASNIVEAGGFFRTTSGAPTPDVEIVVLPTMLGAADIGPAARDAYTLTVQVLKPTSTGTVRLRAALPSAKVRIQHNHFATEEDLATIVDGLRINLDIAGRSPLKELERAAILHPASLDDADLRDYVRRNGQGLWHPSSTCAMGAVVDSELRVLGTEGLRVADASIMPSIVRGNPNAAVIMIGERAADLVRGA
jgi:choline dehydrogenase-like flavoprotein